MLVQGGREQGASLGAPFSLHIEHFQSSDELDVLQDRSWHGPPGFILAFLCSHSRLRQDAATRMRRPMKEQEIGQHCQPGQEQVSAMPISLHSKKHWGSMNSTGTPTSPKSDPNQQKQMRQRQVYPACNSRPSPTPASVPRVTTTRNSRPARTGLWLV